MARAGVLETREADGDMAADLLERRWFASMTAARAKQSECQALRELMEIARASWQEAYGELCRLEVLRDALGEEMAELSALREAVAGGPGIEPGAASVSSSAAA